MECILITNDVDTAKYAQDCGVDRIMVDLEIKGKMERQGHLDTLISKHTLQDVEKIRNVLTTSKLQVRINPYDNESPKEIIDVINTGADILMLPMFETASEVENFINITDKKITTSLLLETAPALSRIDNILDCNGIDEIHIGLNDLHLQLKLKFMFELLSGGLVEFLSQKITHKGIKFGFGGIARIGGGLLDSSLILSEHKRLNSEVVILSRDFTGGATKYKDLIKKVDLKAEVLKTKEYINSLDLLTTEDVLENKKMLCDKINTIILS